MNNQGSPIWRAGIYLRVSTKGQETDNQLLQMQRFMEAQKWERRDFIDHVSGKTANRSQFQALFEAASRRDIDVVVFWSLDRFTREGALATLQHLERLGSYGVRFRSLPSPTWILAESGETRSSLSSERLLNRSEYVSRSGSEPDWRGQGKTAQKQASR